MYKYNTVDIYIYVCVYIYSYISINIGGFYPGASSLARLGIKIWSQKQMLVGWLPLDSVCNMTDCSPWTLVSIHQSLESWAFQCSGAHESCKGWHIILVYRPSMMLQTKGKGKAPKSNTQGQDCTCCGRLLKINLHCRTLQLFRMYLYNFEP